MKENEILMNGTNEIIYKDEKENENENEMNTIKLNKMNVLPGDDVTDIIKTNNLNKIRLGSGLKLQKNNKIICLNAGILRYRSPNRYWIDYTFKRYIPSNNDGVVGMIEDKIGDYYRVNIGSSSLAMLGYLAFDGATKRSSPNLKKGSLIYARVLSTYKYMDPELTCEAPSNTIKKDWITGLSLYGELVGGLTIKLSITHAKNLLKNDCVILRELGKKFAFELAVGLNGIVWIHSNDSKTTILISNAIENSDFLTDKEICIMVQKLWKTV